jgi:hypothetical protein
MTRTLTALYETREQAERVQDQLVAARLGDNVTIRDQEAAESGGHRDLVEWIGDLFGGHHDSHLYAEGLRRGHVLMTVKVDDLNETRAAELLDAAQPIDLDHAQTTWRPETWTPRPTAASRWTAGERAKQEVPDAEPPAPAETAGQASRAPDADVEDSDFQDPDLEGSLPEVRSPESIRIMRVRVYALYE